jgi:hypothetical protein
MVAVEHVEGSGCINYDSIVVHIVDCFVGYHFSDGVVISSDGGIV